MSDEEIVGKVRNGETDLFEFIVRRYNQKIFRIARSYLSDDEDAKDVMQIAYLKAFKNLNQFRGEARFSTWLVRIVINEALKAVNRNKKKSELHSVTREADRDQTYDNGVDTPESIAINNEMKLLLEQAIDRLPSKYRSVLVLREIEQMSIRETADCLRISMVNVKVRLFRAKRLLRVELEKAVGYGNLYMFKGKHCDAMTARVMQKIRRLDAEQS